ncbi:MAG TPA: peptidoglycan DD-metalloendopeptidase family protein [Actinomycetota bacterium]|nr:peptidoglycan DD-metalloendopeptidase family protein [Actinomycetota bacterium]
MHATLPGPLRAAPAVCGIVLAALLPLPAQGQPVPPGRTRVGELREEAKRTAQRIDAARAELDAAVTGYEQARTRMAGSAKRLREARETLQVVAAAHDAGQGRIRRRAIALYKGERMQMLDSLLGSDSLDAFIRRMAYLSSVTERDLRLVEGLGEKREELSRARDAVRAEAAAVHAELRVMSGRSGEILDRMRVLQSSLERVKHDLEVELSKWRFPVQAPYSFVDSWGAPRMVGTQYEHAHQGQDIFAPMGTPVVAVVSGTVFNVGTATLGGNKLWLQGDDGHRYYYAHLSGYAPDGAEGRRVDAGTVLGFVGDTGNARGTPPHLHFEMHTAQGPINPYQTLRQAERGWVS